MLVECRTTGHNENLRTLMNITRGRLQLESPRTLDRSQVPFRSCIPPLHRKNAVESSVPLLFVNDLSSYLVGVASLISR